MLQQRYIMANKTLPEFLIQESDRIPPKLADVIRAIATASTLINHKLSRNGLIKESGKSGVQNVYGEHVEKLDTFADQVMQNELLSCQHVHAIGSEEIEKPKFSADAGEYIVTYDPMDGSSNIDTNLSIGTIFGIYPKNDTILQKGSTLIASGYILYGPSRMLVLATKQRVDGFTFDPDTDAFVLSYPNIRIPEATIYAINEGNWELFSKSDQAYLTSIKKNGGYSLRYVGSMVADVHRTLLKGGIFLYPADSKHANGKLRLLYEVAPFSFLIRASGGDAISYNQDPLEISPETHDQRVPIALGSTNEIATYRSFQS